MKFSGLFATNDVGNTLSGELGFIPSENLFGLGLEFHTSLGFYKGYYENFGVLSNEIFYRTSLFDSEILIGGGLSIWDSFSVIVPIASLNYNFLTGGGAFLTIYMLAILLWAVDQLPMFSKLEQF